MLKEELTNMGGEEHDGEHNPIFSGRNCYKN